MAKCDKRSPLTRGGTTQPERNIAEREADFFQLDERESADMILYARRLSQEIIFYNGDNQPDGDWEPFFASDIAAAVAALARLPVTAFRTALTDVDEYLRAEPARPESELRAHFNMVFHLPVALFAQLAKAHAFMPRDHALYRTLGKLIENDLSGPLATLVTFYNGARGAGLPLGDPEVALDPSEFSPPPADRPPLSDTIGSAVFTADPLSQRIIDGPSLEALGQPDWASFVAAIAGDPTPYQQAVGPNQLYEQIYDALNYNLLVDDLERIFQGIQRARDLAEAALQDAIANSGEHPPHYALFLSFLSMLEPARDALNEMTGRHLDFYYRDILQLSPRPAQPGSVHVKVELARGVESHEIVQGVGLRAGKDSLGQAVTYRTADTFVANRASVVEKRAIRVETTTILGKNHQRLFASPCADSADGLGADLPADAFGWRPFGPRADTDPSPPLGRVGFALADRRLFLREGKREILMAFELDVPMVQLVFARMSARLSAEEGWQRIPSIMIVHPALPKYAFAYIELDADQPPIVPFNPDLHREENGAGYQAGLPVAELTFDFDAPDDSTARAFADLRESSVVNSWVTVHASGLRNFSIQSQDGVADTSKPFTAFGAQPRLGSALMLGSAELFAKDISLLNLHFRWDQLYLQNTHFRNISATSFICDVDYLSKGSWIGATDTVTPLTSATVQPVVAMPSPTLADATAEMVLEDQPYDTSAKNGFMRLRLRSDFGHSAYATELTRALIELAKDKEIVENTAYNYVNHIPLEPYTPTLQSLTISYQTPADPAAMFYHVAPFGQAVRNGPGTPLLPPLDYEGALFLGIAELKTPARLTLLVQVSNGTGDPLLEKPQLDFHYLSDGVWMPFDQQDVDDKTDNFATSAIIGLAVPSLAVSDGALMPEGLLWIRMAAPQNAAAVNSLIGVEAQVLRAEFADDGNDPDFMANALPAESIAKPVTPDPKIKKLQQPYAGFGGRAEEDEASFRRRASERLRHKDRASTMWDYEHLVLEAVPELYRVKCLNHTELVRQSGKIVADNEVSPGSVVVVTVPWTTGRPHLNPLRPYTDQATLNKVRYLLEPRVSPFIRVEVANPKFEEVHVSFDVAFREGVDDIAFYLAELNTAIVNHLAPWSTGAATDIAFGGKMRKSVIIDFVEELPFIDYLQNFEMYHRPNPDQQGWTRIDLNTIQATTARSILVSAPSHDVREIV